MTTQSITHDVDFDDLISRGTRELTALDIAALLEELPALLADIPTEPIPQFPDAAPKLRFLADVVHQFATGTAASLAYQAVLEAAYALRYFRRDADIIPDCVENLGFLDDAVVVNRVLARNRSAFSKYARKRRLSWEKIDPLKAA